MGSWKGGGNQFLYFKLPTNDIQQPAFPLEIRLRLESQVGLGLNYICIGKNNEIQTFLDEILKSFQRT